MTAEPEPADLPPVLEEIPTDGIVVTAGDQPPAPVLAGTFAVYSDGAGGMVLVADTVNTDGTPGVVHRKHIPAALVRLLNGGGGAAGAMLRRLAG
jgi:hypothetical protein